MLAGLKLIRRRLHAPTDAEVEDVIHTESQDSDSVDDLRAHQRLEDLRNRLQSQNRRSASVGGSQAWARNSDLRRPSLSAVRRTFRPPDSRSYQQCHHFISPLVCLRLPVVGRCHRHGDT